MFDVVKQVVGFVRVGKVYLLVVLVDKNLLVFCYCSFWLYNVQVGQQVGKSFGLNKFMFNDEFVNVWIGVGMQFNGIGYIGIDNVYYNGNCVVDFVIVDGVKKFGVEKVLLIVMCGVVFDMIVYYGKLIVLGGIEFMVVDIQVVLKKQGLMLCKGDVVLFNIGWLELVGKDDKQFFEVEFGIGMEVVKWLVDQGIVVFGGDMWVLEVYLNLYMWDEFLINQYMFVKCGIYNLELIDSCVLVCDKVWEFFFVFGQLLYVGFMQVNINLVVIC